MDRDVVHELNNALLPARAYAELALRKLERGDDPRKELEEVLAAVDRAGELAQSLRTPPADRR
jgi:signal transduction histidine kinase